MGNKVQKLFAPDKDDEYADITHPTGLYDSCPWDTRAARKLILSSQLAPRVKGSESANEHAVDECPICFLHYSQMNTSKCCQQLVCTECWLQTRPPRAKAPCPFCNAPDFVVHFGKPLHLAVESVSRSRSASEDPPASSSPASSSPRSIPITPDQSPPPTNLSSSADRRELEERMRHQRLTAMMGGGISPPQASDLRRRALSEHHSERYPARAGRNSALARLMSLTGPSDIQQMEEIMLMEAIRQSLAESEEQHQTQSQEEEEEEQQQQPPTPAAEEDTPPPPPSSDPKPTTSAHSTPQLLASPGSSHSSNDFAVSDEDEEFKLAIALSLSESTDSPQSDSAAAEEPTDSDSAAAEEPTDSESVVAEEPANTEESSKVSAPSPALTPSPQLVDIPPVHEVPVDPSYDLLPPPPESQASDDIFKLELDSSSPPPPPASPHPIPSETHRSDKPDSAIPLAPSFISPGGVEEKWEQRSE